MQHSIAGLVHIMGAESKELGIHFVQQGEILLTGDHWRIIVSLNIMEICQGITNLCLHIKDTQQTWWKATKCIPDLGVHEGFLRRLLQPGQQLEEAGQALMELLPTSQERRGLFNIGGKLLRVIFGTAEEDDVDHLRLSLEHTNQRTMEVIHLQKEMLTVTRKLTRRAEMNSANIKQMTEKLEESTEIFAKWIDNIDHKVSDSEVILKTFVNVTAKLQDLELAIMLNLSDLNNLLVTLQKVSQGKLSVGLISPSEMRALLVRVCSSLQQELGLIAGAEEAYPYYQAAPVGKRFTLFRVHALPVHDPSIIHFVQIQ
ncbi:uncharacterized protein LOC120354554 [Nilaparvata lugens]|uniref:uncharacterized protein LOC120354554 n=1 Tax=Nilaparvata lugens TaxID=108931 RepID=UPI00193E571B|nr:uncharacterized protein LOC120354554 [Nilaparvata lugens]